MSATEFAIGTRVQAVLVQPGELAAALPDKVGTVVPMSEWPSGVPEEWTEDNTIIVRWDRKVRPAFSVFRPDVAARMLRVADATPTNTSGDTPSLVALDLAEAASRVGATTDALLTLPTDAAPAALREAFAAARKALDEFETASSLAPTDEPTDAEWVAMADAYGPDCDACSGDDDVPHVDGCRRIAQINRGAR